MEQNNIKSEIISRLSQFFDVPSHKLSKFNFDGEDSIEDLTRALNGTNYEGVAHIVRVAINMVKRDLGIDESFVNQNEVQEIPQFEGTKAQLDELTFIKTMKHRAGIIK
jgi:hypothetical protein